MEERVRGTVTPLASMFPADEAHKAAERVQDTIADKRRELERVSQFIADNSGLVNLVQKLPEELHHDIMVPFGKAAFFPGRLIHTNEFMVLLGEGYYAERTSKQTIEILRRRGKALETHADSLKSIIKDLETEALFFDRTASEAVEGLVEIREEISSEVSDEEVAGSGQVEQDSVYGDKVVNDDEEYARIMSKLDELEKEEAAEAADECENETSYDDPDRVPDQSSLDRNLKYLEGSNSWKGPSHSKDGNAHNEEFFNQKQQQPALSELVNSQLPEIHVQPDKVTIRSISEDKMSHGIEPLHNLEGHNSAGRSTRPLVLEETVQAAKSSNSEVSIQPPKPKVDSLKAFTGSIIEHSPNLPVNPRDSSTTTSEAPNSQPKRPLSRFKMQRK